MSRIESEGLGKNEGFIASSLIQKTQRAIEKAVGHEREWKVAYVDTKVSVDDIKHFAQWYQDKETARHLINPLRSSQELENYYLHGQENHPMFFVARNIYGDPLGVSTLLINKPNLKNSRRRIAYIENTIVNNKFKRRQIGSVLQVTMNDYAFSVGENGKPRFDEAHLQILIGKEAGDWRGNFEFFGNHLGYVLDIERSPRRMDVEEAGMKNREVFSLFLNPKWWGKAKERNADLRGAELHLVG